MRFSETHRKMKGELLHEEVAPRRSRYRTPRNERRICPGRRTSRTAASCRRTPPRRSRTPLCLERWLLPLVPQPLRLDSWLLGRPAASRSRLGSRPLGCPPRRLGLDPGTLALGWSGYLDSAPNPTRSPSPKAKAPRFGTALAISAFPDVNFRVRFSGRPSGNYSHGFSIEKSAGTGRTPRETSRIWDRHAPVETRVWQPGSIQLRRNWDRSSFASSSISL